jgi:hypothetical protein
MIMKINDIIKIKYAYKNTNIEYTYIMLCVLYIHMINNIYTCNIFELCIVTHYQW